MIQIIFFSGSYRKSFIKRFLSDATHSVDKWLCEHVASLNCGKIFETTTKHTQVISLEDKIKSYEKDNYKGVWWTITIPTTDYELLEYIEDVKNYQNIKTHYSYILALLSPIRHFVPFIDKLIKNNSAYCVATLYITLIKCCPKFRESESRYYGKIMIWNENKDFVKQIALSTSPYEFYQALVRAGYTMDLQPLKQFF